MTMYLDTLGIVTAGIGHAMFGVGMALRLPWHVIAKGLNRLATPDEVEAEFQRVKALPPGQQAKSYALPTSPFLLQSDVLELARVDVTATVEEIHAHYPMFETWPDQAKLALLDMGLNLGLDKLTREYPHLNAALTAAPSDPREWLVCAHECGRNTDDKGFAQRNHWTASMFAAAYDSTKQPIAIPSQG
jgi:hypothetical protein